MVASMFEFLKKMYDPVIQPYASEPPTGKDFLTNPKAWDIYLHVAGHAPRVGYCSAGSCCHDPCDCASPPVLLRKVEIQGLYGGLTVVRAVPRWQNDGSVVLGLAMGLIAHLVGRDVPRHFAFSGEVDASGGVVCPLLPSEGTLRSMLDRHVHTLIMGRAPVGAEDAAVPDGVTLHYAVVMRQVLSFVWP
jgi:hypothetical protein